MESKPEKRRRRVAGWIGIPGISLWGALRFLEWLFSLGGASGNAEGWRQAGLVMLSAIPPWLMPALFVGASVALLIYLVGVVPEFYLKGRHRMVSLMATPEGVKHLSVAINIAMVAVMVALLGGVIYYLFIVYEPPPKPVWVHPTMTLAEQEKAKAACRISAYETIGAGTGSIKDPAPRHRAVYVGQCLTVKGFQLKQDDDD